MPDNRLDAQELDAQEEAGLPTPAISEGSEPAGSAASDVSALAEKLSQLEQTISKLPDLVDARFKSAKDKRFSKIEEILAAVEKSGGDPSKIRDDLQAQQLDERFAALEAKLSRGAVGAAPKDEVQEETAKLLSRLGDELGVSVSNDELQELVDRKTYRNSSDWYADVSALAVKKAKQGIATPSTMVPPAGRGSGQHESEEALTARLEEILNSGRLTDPKTKQERAEIQSKLDKLSPQQKVIT